MVGRLASLDTGEGGATDRAAAAGDAREGVADGGRWGRQRAHRRGCSGALDEEGRDRRMAVEISGVTLCPSNDLITVALCGS